ncbi:MAG: hypothetical protein H6Q72_1411 [Firmicutes bacterium]|nr:hypothetical protein [Bacillota bacterium]
MKYIKAFIKPLFLSIFAMLVFVSPITSKNVFANTPDFNPYDYKFSKVQSMELSDLIKVFISIVPKNGTNLLSWDAGNSENVPIYWGKVRHFQNNLPYPSIRPGAVGVLFNGNTSKIITQEWVAGELKKREVENGFTCSLNIRGKLYWAPRNINIEIPISPIRIAKYFNQGKFSFGDYLSNSGINNELLWEKGSLDYGETAWKVYSNYNPVWIICKTNHGANGLIGDVEIMFFYTLADAESDSSNRRY